MKNLLLICSTCEVSNEGKARVEKFYYKIEFTDKTVCNEGGENCYCHLLHYQFSFFKNSWRRWWCRRLLRSQSLKQHLAPQSLCLVRSPLFIALAGTCAGLGVENMHAVSAI